MNDILNNDISRRKTAMLLGGGALIAAFGLGHIIHAHAGPAPLELGGNRSITVMIKATVKEGEIGHLVPFLKKNLPNTRGFSGALNVVVFFDEKTGSLAIYEEWTSRQHHQNYIKFVTDKGVMKQLVGFLKAPPVIKYYTRLKI